MSDLDLNKISQKSIDGSKVRAILERFQKSLATGEKPRIEEFIFEIEPSIRLQIMEELLHIEIKFLSSQGTRKTAEEYLQQFPELAGHPDIRERLKTLCAAASTVAERRPARNEESDEALPSTICMSVTEFPKFGRYVVAGTLGSGAFGEVFRGRDPQLNRDVAIKVLKADRVADGSYELFVKEGQSLAQFRHPGIIAVYDVGLTEDGRPYTVSELIDGTTLKARLSDGKQPFAQMAALISDVASSLHQAHIHGFVHRDVKPANILLDQKQRPHLADFGLAIHETQQLSHSGELAGTFPYMSPEQIRGETNRLDGRADIWSLGIILYEGLTGRRPFGGQTTFQIRDEILNRSPKPLRQIDPDIPAELERICLKCLAKSPDDRYLVADDLVNDLRIWREQQTQSASELIDQRTSNHVVRTVPILTAFAVGIALLGCVISILRPKFFRPEVSHEIRSTATSDTTSDTTVPTSESPSALPNLPQPKAEEFSVIQLRTNANSFHLIGNMGSQTYAADVGDGIQIKLRLTMPEYCYLLAFNTDGSTQLCYPDNENTVPAQTKNLDFPAYATDAFFLTEGIGQQAFVAVISPEPLPAYATWKTALPERLWQKVPSGEAMRFDGKHVEPCMGSHDRGTVSRLPGVQSFESLCQTLRDKVPTGQVRAIAFPVKPKK